MLHVGSENSEEDAALEDLEDDESDQGADLEDRRERPTICAATTRGDLVDSASFPDQDLRLHIGICGAEIGDEPVLEVSNPIQ